MIFCRQLPASFSIAHIFLNRAALLLKASLLSLQSNFVPPFFEVRPPLNRVLLGLQRKRDAVERLLAQGAFVGEILLNALKLELLPLALLHHLACGGCGGLLGEAAFPEFCVYCEKVSVTKRFFDGGAITKEQIDSFERFLRTLSYNNHILRLSHLH